MEFNKKVGRMKKLQSRQEVLDFLLEDEIREEAEDEEIHDLLVSLSDKGVSLSCGQDDETLKAKPASALTHEEIDLIRDHKVKIIRAIQDDELAKTGYMQCERHVFEELKRWKEERGLGL